MFLLKNTKVNGASVDHKAQLLTWKIKLSLSTMKKFCPCQRSLWNFWFWLNQCYCYLKLSLFENQGILRYPHQGIQGILDSTFEVSLHIEHLWMNNFLISWDHCIRNAAHSWDEVLSIFYIPWRAYTCSNSASVANADLVLVFVMTCIESIRRITNFIKHSGSVLDILVFWAEFTACEGWLRRQWPTK